VQLAVVHHASHTQKGKHDTRIASSGSTPQQSLVAHA
jgi:hypothetical protein